MCNKVITILLLILSMSVGYAVGWTNQPAPTVVEAEPKVSFTSQLKMLTGIQNILYKHGITSKIYPKSGCQCFVIEIRAKADLRKTIDLIYSDENFIVLKRKYEKAVALRLELGENGESAKRQSRAKPAEQEGVETSGEEATPLNNRTQRPRVA